MIGKARLSISRSDISMSEVDIASIYLGIQKLPCLINNPLRDDKNPSLGVFTKDMVSVGFKDFATGKSYTLFNFLSELWGCSRYDVLERLYKDTQGTTKLKATKIKKVKYSHLTDLKVKVRDWEDWDIEYWNNYGIEFNFLKQSNTYPIEYIILQYGENSLISKADKYAYVYVEFKDGNTSLKVYQPYASRENKFKNNHNNSVWDLWDKLPEKGDKLIITSSKKDSMCVWSNTGIPCTNMQSESVMPKESVIAELKSRFKDIYVLYDNDYTKVGNPGQTYALKICNEFDLKNIKIPDEYESKDPSDLYKNHGKEIFNEILIKLTN